MNRNVELGCDHRDRYQHGCVFGDSEDVSTERGWLSGLSHSQTPYTDVVRSNLLSGMASRLQVDGDGRVTKRTKSI